MIRGLYSAATAVDALEQNHEAPFFPTVYARGTVVMFIIQAPHELVAQLAIQSTQSGSWSAPTVTVPPLALLSVH